MPLAAYSWQRFPDAEGRDAVTFESWPQFAAQQVAEGFTTLKLSMTSYEPDDHVELVARIREAVPPEIDIRIDAHGSWNDDRGAPHHARARALSRLQYIEQPLASLLPHRFYAGAAVPARRGGGFQREYYFRKLEELRRDTGLADLVPLVDAARSCSPTGVSRAADAWEFDWYLMERYDPVDISVPDIGLGVFGLWRLFQMTRFMGLHLQIHSNSELGLQSSFRGAMFAALGYYPESPASTWARCRASASPWTPSTTRCATTCSMGGKLPLAGRPHRAVAAAGPRPRARPRAARALPLDARSARASIASRRRRAGRNYLLDRPRRRTMSGWPKRPGPERFDRQAYPYDLTQMLGGEPLAGRRRRAQHLERPQPELRRRAAPRGRTVPPGELRAPGAP